MRRVIAIVLAVLVCAPATAWAAYDARVEAAQRALTEKGFDPGPVDGLMGRRTRTALRAFQDASGLESTGRVDAATIGALGLAAPAAPDAPAQGAAPAPSAPAPPTRLTPTRAGRLLDYTRLGWAPPGSADTVRARSDAASGIVEVTSKRGTVLVSDVGQIFLLRRAGDLPGEPCRPEAGEPSMEFLIGPDGPVNFTGSRDAPLCQLGPGVVLREGMTLRMVETWWGDTRVPPGRVRVGPKGLEYLR